MARMEKEQIVEDLKTLKVDFDEKAKYWDLYKLLKSVTNPDSSGGLEYSHFTLLNLNLSRKCISNVTCINIHIISNAL